MDGAQIGDAATLLATLRDAKHPVGLRQVLSTWDMLQVDVPTRERLQMAASILVGSGLAAIDDTWAIRPTAAGEQLRRSVPGKFARVICAELVTILATRDLSVEPLRLPAEVFDPILADYLNPAPPTGWKRLLWGR